MPAERLSVPVGSLLILREEFEAVTRDQNRAAGVRFRAMLMQSILDELIEHREKEASNG
jgi:hypothetical protein